MLLFVTRHDMGKRADGKKNYNMWLSEQEKSLLRDVAAFAGVDMHEACMMGLRLLEKQQNEKKRKDKNERPH